MKISELRRLLQSRQNEYGDGEINNMINNVSVVVGKETRYLLVWDNDK